MYAANTANTPPVSGWSTSATVGGLAENRTYYVFAKVAGGMNYEDAYSTGVSMQTTAKTDILTILNWRINTGDESGSGTDGHVSGYALYCDDTSSGSTIFDTNDYNDFEQYGDQTYYVGIYEDPWMIKGVHIENSGSNWLCDFIELTIGVNKKPAYQFTISKWMKNGESDDKTTDAALPGFRRVITSTGDFDSWGGEYTIEGSSTGTIAYTFNGTVTDQNYGTFVAYDKDDAPTISVSLPEADEAEYGSCFTYDNYGLTIDKSALYAKMTQLGVTQLVFTAKLSFPTRSTTPATAVTTKTITINKP
jgi:hypothetical protein